MIGPADFLLRLGNVWFDRLFFPISLMQYRIELLVRNLVKIHFMAAFNCAFLICIGQRLGKALPLPCGMAKDNEYVHDTRLLHGTSAFLITERIRVSGAIRMRLGKVRPPSFRESNKSGIVIFFSPKVSALFHLGRQFGGLAVHHEPAVAMVMDGAGMFLRTVDP